MDDSLLRVQEECFQDYEGVIENLSSKLRTRDNCIYEQKQNMKAVERQLALRNSVIRRKNNETAVLMQSNLALQTQLESTNLSFATEASENEEKINHYKALVKGLQKTAENAEESAQYLRHMKKLIFEYENGETLEDSLKTSDRLCSICMENHANIVCIPCMHMEFCHGCALEVHGISANSFSSNKRVNVDSKCPRCKGSVEELLYVFT